MPIIYPLYPLNLAAGPHPPPLLGVPSLIATTLQIKIFCEKIFFEYTFRMAGILDILQLDTPTVPAGPLNIYQPPVQEPNRLEELLSNVGEQERFDVLQEIRKSDRKELSPKYIYDKGYTKNQFSFFNDGYDANVDSEINPELIETEFSDFIQLLDGKTDINKVFGTETFSPFAQDMLPEIGRYKEQHQALPSSFKDFLMNKYTTKT